ncbi:MAG: hypothetical protein LBG58_09245 [Planctomycetaceae bacterium]|nr:hypothetical protein [Planctomycetaceae bacterium]
MYVSRLTDRNRRNFTNIDVAFQETAYRVTPNALGKPNMPPMRNMS